MDKSGNTAAAELGIRPLNARSVVLSALLGSHPPEMPVAALVELGARFGIPAGTLRTALSRMAASGEVVADDGRYRLAGRLIERQREQDEGRATPDPDWDGRWWTVVVTADGTRPIAARRRFRSAMAGARLGELRPDVWMRPANIGVALDLDDVIAVRGRLHAGDPARLVARLWDGRALERRAATLREALAGTVPALADGDDAVIAPAFTTFAACLQFLRGEPQLPSELAPSPQAHALRAEYGRAEPLLQERLRALNRRAISRASR